MKTRTLVLCAMLCCITGAIQAQTTETKKTEQAADDTIYNAVEQKPEFPGGFQKFYEYVAGSFKYPENFKGKGHVITQFIVEKDGSLSHVKALRDLGSGTGEEAVRVLSASPKWQPGMQNGKPVRVLYSLPITLVSK